MKITNQEPNQKSDRKIKIHSREKETITEPLRPKSKPYLLCMWYVVLCVYFLHVTSAVPVTCKSLSGSLHFDANQGPALDHLCQKNSSKGGRRKHQRTLNLLVVNQQLWRPGVPNPIYKNNYLGSFPKLFYSGQIMSGVAHLWGHV